MYPQISYWAFQGGLTGERPMGEAMELARKIGFDGIELCIGGQGDLTTKTSAKQCKALAEQAKAVGIEIGSVASGLLWEINPASPKKSIRDRALKTAKDCLRVTADLGAQHLLLLTGHVDVFFLPDADPVPYDDCYKRSVAFGRAVAREASKLGVQACFENVWNRFLLSPLEWKQFINDIGKGGGMYFDVGNVWNFGYPQHWIDILGRKIRRVHVKDFKRSVGTADGFVMLGDGDVPLAESLALLKKKGYNGPVTAEIMPGPDDKDEKKFLKTIHRRLTKVMP
jgi:hexulose-6-phosphate isomerase